MPFTDTMEAAAAWARLPEPPDAWRGVEFYKGRRPAGCQDPAEAYTAAAFAALRTKAEWRAAGFRVVSPFAAFARLWPDHCGAKGRAFNLYPPAALQPVMAKARNARPEEERPGGGW